MSISKKRVKANLHTNPATTRRPWWLLAVLGAVLLVGGGILLWWNSNRPTVPVEVTGKPKVKVDQEKIDYGDVKLDTPIETVFRVSNAGDQPLQIMGEPQVELVEGCWPPRAVVSSTTIKPGQEATVSLQFMMHEGMDGQHEFRVHLRTNDPVEPDKQLTIRSNWVP